MTDATQVEETQRHEAVDVVCRVYGLDTTHHASYRECESRLRKTCLHALARAQIGSGRADLYDDVFQETYLTVGRHLAELGATPWQDASKGEGYVVRACINCLISEVRKRARETGLTEGIEATPKPLSPEQIALIKAWLRSSAAQLTSFERFLVHGRLTSSLDLHALCRNVFTSDAFAFSLPAEFVLRWGDRDTLTISDVPGGRGIDTFIKRLRAVFASAFTSFFNRPDCLLDVPPTEGKPSGFVEPFDSDRLRVIINPTGRLIAFAVFRLDRGTRTPFLRLETTIDERSSCLSWLRKKTTRALKELTDAHRRLAA